MRVNEHIALIAPKVLLVPYSKHHVPTYHEWMKDPDLQKATASEPLSIDEEYAMQRSWRADPDKLTFIVVAPPPPTPPSHGRLDHVVAAQADAPDRMIGDVNLFLVDDDDDECVEMEGDIAPRYVVGELELMIARKDQRRQGYGKAALQAFIGYVRNNLDSILAEYDRKDDSDRCATLSYLRVRIGADNAPSIALFESIGFKGISDKPNFFGELEFRRNIESMWDAEADVHTTEVRFQENENAHHD